MAQVHQDNVSPYKRAKIERNDEIGELASQFNAMMSLIERHQVDLEGIVEDRTNQLMSAKSMLAEAESCPRWAKWLGELLTKSTLRSRLFS